MPLQSRESFDLSSSFSRVSRYSRYAGAVTDYYSFFFFHVDVSVGNRRAEVLPNIYIFGRQDRRSRTDHVRPWEKEEEEENKKIRAT